MTRQPRFLVCGLALCAAVHAVIGLAPAFGQRDGSGSDTATRVKAIRKEYGRINAGIKNYAKKERDLSGFSTEGGTLTGYYHKNELRKMVATYYGETGRTTKEFYFADGALVFVLATRRNYVGPLTFDGKDTGKIASTEQNRFYFSGGTLIRWLKPTGKPVRPNDASAQSESKEIRTTAADLVNRLRLPPS